MTPSFIRYQWGQFYYILTTIASAGLLVSRLFLVLMDMIYFRTVLRMMAMSQTRYCMPWIVSMWRGSWGFNGALDENCLILTKSSNKLWQYFICPFYSWFLATVTYSMLTSWLDTYQTHQIHERLRSLQTRQETYGNIKRLSFMFSSRGNVKKQNQLRGEPPKL